MKKLLILIFLLSHQALAATTLLLPQADPSDSSYTTTFFPSYQGGMCDSSVSTCYQGDAFSAPATLPHFSLVNKTTDSTSSPSTGTFIQTNEQPGGGTRQQLDSFGYDFSTVCGTITAIQVWVYAKDNTGSASAALLGVDVCAGASGSEAWLGSGLPCTTGAPNWDQGFNYGTAGQITAFTSGASLGWYSFTYSGLTLDPTTQFNRPNVMIWGQDFCFACDGSDPAGIYTVYSTFIQVTSTASCYNGDGNFFLFD